MRLYPVAVRRGNGMVTMTAGQFALCLIGAAVMGAVTLAVLAIELCEDELRRR